jgi:hypothetical protein
MKRSANKIVLGSILLHGRFANMLYGIIVVGLCSDWDRALPLRYRCGMQDQKEYPAYTNGLIFPESALQSHQYAKKK